MINLDVTLAMVNAASPEPWEENIETDGCGTYFATGPHVVKERGMDKKTLRELDNRMAADAKLIASAPATIRELVEVCQKLKALADDLIKRVNSHERPDLAAPVPGEESPWPASAATWPKATKVPTPTVPTPGVPVGAPR